MACQAAAAGLPSVLAPRRCFVRPVFHQRLGMGRAVLPGWNLSSMAARHLRQTQQLNSCRHALVAAAAAASPDGEQSSTPSPAAEQQETELNILQAATASDASNSGSGSSNSDLAAPEEAAALAAEIANAEASASPAAAAAQEAANANSIGTASAGSSSDEADVVGEQRPASVAQESSGSPASEADPSTAGPSVGVLGALATIFRVLADTLRLLLGALVVEPLSWVLKKSGLLAVRAGDVVSMLEKANRQAAVDPDRLAGALRVLNRHSSPQATVEVGG